MNMTRHEIKSAHYVEPYCFEDEQEEQWYRIGLLEGVELTEDEIISDIETHISEMTVSEHDRSKLLDELKQIIRNGKIQH